jgi:hypothetical protein
MADGYSLQGNLPFSERPITRAGLANSEEEDKKISRNATQQAGGNRKNKQKKERSSKFSLFFRSSEDNSLKSGSHGKQSGENSNGSNEVPSVLHRNDFNHIRKILKQELSKLQLQQQPSITVHHHNVTNLISYNSPNSLLAPKFRHDGKVSVPENKEDDEEEIFTGFQFKPE